MGSKKPVVPGGYQHIYQLSMMGRPWARFVYWVCIPGSRLYLGIHKVCFICSLSRLLMWDYDCDDYDDYDDYDPNWLILLWVKTLRHPERAGEWMFIHVYSRGTKGFDPSHTQRQNRSISREYWQDKHITWLTIRKQL